MVDLSAVWPSVGHGTPAGRAGSVLSATERVRRDQEDAARPRDVSAPSVPRRGNTDSPLSEH